MLLHYLGEVTSLNLLQITTEKIKQRVVVVFDKKERLCCRTVDWRQAYTVFTAYARSVHRSPARMHENACATRQCIVSDALVDLTPHLLYTLFQFVSVVHPRLVHLLLDDAPDPVINRIKVRAICWP